MGSAPKTKMCRLIGTNEDETEDPSVSLGLSWMRDTGECLLD